LSDGFVSAHPATDWRTENENVALAGPVEGFDEESQRLLRETAR
jgi:hypothetical protein